MNTVRGAIILAEYIQPMYNGRWIIGGTLTGITCYAQAHHFHNVMAYLRFQVERAGKFPVCTRLIVRNAVPHAPPLANVVGEALVANPLEPAQCACSLPSFVVQCPRPITDLGPSQSLVIQMAVECRVGESDLASSPLVITFRNPAHRGHHERDHEERPDGGHQ